MSKTHKSPSSSLALQQFQHKAFPINNFMSGNRHNMQKISFESRTCKQLVESHFDKVHLKEEKFQWYLTYIVEYLYNYVYLFWRCVPYFWDTRTARVFTSSWFYKSSSLVLLPSNHMNSPDCKRSIWTWMFNAPVFINLVMYYKYFFMTFQIIFQQIKCIFNFILILFAFCQYLDLP